MNQMNLLKSNQIGIRKGFRTVDHVLTIIALVDKYLSKNQNCISVLLIFGKHTTVYGESVYFID